MMEGKDFKRGEIYFANLNPYIGSEQGGIRPVLVIQNDIGNFFSPTLIVSPLTTKQKKLPTHYEITGIEQLEGSVVLLEQIRTIDKRRIGSFVGRLNRQQMKRIDELLQISLHIYLSEAVEAP